MNKPLLFQRFRIWDNQTKRFTQNDDTLHCTPFWTINILDGSILSLDETQSYKAHTTPKYYSSGIELVKEKRYVLSQSTNLSLEVVEPSGLTYCLLNCVGRSSIGGN